MNKFVANVRLKDDKDAGGLVKAFFENFNPESSISLKGNEAILEIFFNDPPMEMVEAIRNCKIIQFNYGKLEKIETAIDEMTKQVNHVLQENKSSIEEIPNKKIRKARKSVKALPKSAEIKIPELDEIASKATSFEDFAKLVSEWLEMDKRKEFFTNLVILSAEVDNIGWEELEAALNSKKISYIQYDKAWSRKQVLKKLPSLKIFKLLKATKQYKNYPFKSEKNIPSEVKIKMECMPEIKTFEKTLANIDKTQPVENRICYVLEAMGLKKLPENSQKQILEIANVALKEKEMSIDDILKKTGIPEEETAIAHMTFAKFVNDFIKENSKSDEKVKLITFLSELKKVIMI